MTTVKPKTIRRFTLALAAIGICCLTQNVARADVVTFTGVTAGCFNCGPGGPFTSPATVKGLTFFPGVFGVTTTPSGNASIGNQNSLNSLGGFSLSAEPFTYNETFTLLVLLEGPPGAASPIFTATVIGEVIQLAQGNLMIDFNNDFQTFSFANGGTFDFRINDLSITPGAMLTMSGDIRNAHSEVPEPATLLLLGSGLTGVAARLRKRRNSKV